jgi:hypothetical protein
MKIRNESMEEKVGTEKKSKVNKFAKLCAQCPTCQYTRTAKEKNLRYYVSRFFQKICFCCYFANKETKQNLQKSKHL